MVWIKGGFGGLSSSQTGACVEATLCRSFVYWVGYYVRLWVVCEDSTSFINLFCVLYPQPRHRARSLFVETKQVYLLLAMQITKTSKIYETSKQILSPPIYGAVPTPLFLQRNRATKRNYYVCTSCELVYHTLR